MRCTINLHFSVIYILLHLPREGSLPISPPGRGFPKMEKKLVILSYSHPHSTYAEIFLLKINKKLIIL